MSRRIVSLLMSMVLTLTLVTPAAFATEVVGGSGTAIIEGNANPADANPSEDSENNEDKNTEDGKDEQPTEPDDEDKGPSEDDEIIADEEDADDGDIYDVQEDTLLGISLYAAADSWDGASIAAVEPNAEGIYEISTAEQLAGLAKLVNGGNNFSGKTIKLTADIDLNNQAWTPIGNGDNSFAFFGTFDGDGYTISGLNVPDANAPGLFGCIFGTVQNLIVKGSVTVGDEADGGDYGEAGGVVCDNNGTVQNCGFYGSVNDEIGLDAGGVAGGGYGKVLNCWYYMTDESSSVSKVSVCTATNCVVISSSGAMAAAKLATLQTNAPDTGKVWSWKEGDAYPTLVSNVSRSMTLKPYLNSCTAKVAVSGLTGESGVYLLENGVNTVTLLLDSGYSGENVYVRTNAANADGQIQLTTSGVSVPIGNAEKTILYYGTEEDFEAGKWYTAGDAPYQISTGKELVYLAQLVNDGNNFSGKTIVLTADIDLNNQAWTPIGNENGFDAELAFSGTFNGDGYTVSGLNVPDTYFPGLFGQISTSAVVQNLIVKGSVTGGDEASGTWAEAAGVAAYNDGCIQNCGFYGTVTGSSDGSVSVYGLTGGMGVGTVKNCWYFKGVGSGADDVCGGTATNCVMISSADPMTAAKLETLKTAAPVTGKVWSWTEGAEYPTLIDPPKTITMQPVFPDCTAVVSAGETTLNVENDYTYEVTSDTVTITVSGNSDTLYYAASESEKDYKPEGGNLTKIDGTTIINKTDLPKTYYYGTEEDFRLLAAWNSALGRSGNTATVTTADRLKALARMVNSGKDSMTGKTITLGGDITLDGSDWTPIGTKDNPFKGTFNGRNGSTYYTISGLNGDLFGVVNGIIQYVTIDGGKGRLVGELKSGKVENCMSTAKVDSSDENAAVGGLVGMAETNATVSSSYYYNADSINVPAVGGSGTVTNCFYLEETSTFDKKGTADDNGARTAEEFQLGRVAYELRKTYDAWVYDTTKTEKMPQLGSSSTTATMSNASELKLTKPEKLPEGVKVTLGNDSDKKALTDAAGNQYYYAASGYPEGVSDVPVTFTAPTGYQIVFAPAATQVGGKDYLRITGSNVEYTYSLVKADIRWYENAGAEKNCVLKSADELMGFCLLANGSIDGEPKDFNGWTLSLGNSIDLENSEWKPIPSFAGEFNGMSHEIKGLNVNYTDDDSNSKTAGMFEKLDSTGKILSLAVSGSVKADGKINNVGGIVGTTAAGSEIRFCRSNIDVKVDAANSTTNGMAYGGVAGKVQGAISNCLNEGTITVDSIKNKCYIGGVAGYVGSAANLCWNTGSVNASGTTKKNIYTGGIVGYGAATNCYNNGSVTGATGKNKNKYVTGGISGNGNVTNSYNLGTVTGAAGKTYNISGGTVVNSYYADIAGKTGIYVKDSAGITDADKSQSITITEVDGKKAYKVGNVELVDVLNGACKNISGALEWINKQEAPNNPVHITRWDGSFEPGVKGVITLVYDPNGGEGAAVTEQQRVEGDTDGSFTIKSDTELGFKHENGTFLGWSKTAGGEVAFKLKNDGSITPASVSVKKDETLTLYAVWSPIWAGSGTEAAPYEIPDVGKLTALQKQVNENGFSYTGKWFRLTNNIDLNNELWTPIGVDALHSFGGSLDGGGKTISGLKVETNGAWAGLFGSVRGTYGVPMTMRDLTLKNGSVKFTSSGTSCSGGLVAAVEGETVLELRNVVAENLTVSGGIFGSGGLLGRGRVAMTNCHNRGGSVTGSYAGGLAGMGYSNLQDHVLAGCTNSAKVVGKRTAGGMTGNETHSDGSYTDCTNSGSISATQGYASGIAAGGSYERCSNSGAVTGQQAAGICVNGSKATNCSNTGAVTGTGTGTGYAAGILTNDGYGGTVEFCWNTGSVEASTPVKAFGILYGWGAYNQVRNSFSYVPGANIGLAPTELKEENVSDSYYLADKKDSVSSVGEWASADDFASGKVAWGVDGGVNAHKNYWTQGANNYPVPIGEGTSTSYYRAQATCGTGGTVTIKRGDGRTGDADNAVYGPSGTNVTVTATPKDSSYALKSLTLDLMSANKPSDLRNGGSFTLGAANAKVVATFASAGSGGGSGSGSGSGSGTGAGDESDEGLQDGVNMDVEYNVKGLVLSTYTEWGSNGGGKTFSQWLKDSPNVLRALIANSLDNMAAAAAAKKTDEASALAQALLASLNEHSGVAGKDGDAISKALQRFMTSGTEATFSTWLTTGSGMASGTLESIFTQYTDSLLALADRLYTKWESSGTSMTFPAWLDAQQVSMENLSETAEEPDTDTTDESQTTEAPEDVPDGQESEGQVSGNSIWEIIGTAVRENPIIVWSIVAVVAALVIVGAVRRYHKVKRDERDDNGAE
jgi:hypothetical protein